MKRIILLVLACLPLLTHAQAKKAETTAELYHRLQKLNFLGTAMYVAAHPDDENTRLIAYLSNQTKARTTYLSLTRGDGGQNLIGPELKESLGVLRTQELLAARRQDGGHQWFSRANDFGFSKHPDETLQIWDKKEVLGDVVRAIRRFQPDVIINRFDHRTPGTTHGHHTASAMLSVEAFDLAGDQNAYSDQLNELQAWQPKRIFFNTSWWFYGSRENFEKADKSNLVSMDIGVYYPLLGKSNNEMAALASSQHLCQGFGRLQQRGSQTEYVEWLKGEPLQSQTDLFAGINTSWSRLPGGEAVGDLLYTVEKNYRFDDPSVHLPVYLEAYALLEGIVAKTPSPLAKNKLEDLRQLILKSAGLYLEVSTNQAYGHAGDSTSLRFELLNRSAVPAALHSARMLWNGGSSDLAMSAQPLANNQKINTETRVLIPTDLTNSTPYWLSTPGSLGMYAVNNTDLIGRPETPAPLQVEMQMELAGKPFALQIPVVYRYARPDKGELYEPFHILPELSLRFDQDVRILNDSEPKEIGLQIKALKVGSSGDIALEAPKGWKIEPSSMPFSLEKMGETADLKFILTPPKKASSGKLTAVASSGGKDYRLGIKNIDYDHIPKQTLTFPSEMQLVRLDIRTKGERIGYVMGAGDAVPEGLRQLGYEVEVLSTDDLSDNSLKEFDAVVMGIRAYNVLDDLKFKQNTLLNYVKEGGTLVIQYNTAGRWRSQFENIGPYPLTLSRNRVTDETAAVELLQPGHPVLQQPNKITSKDFEGWVQERGLYFPSEWDNKYTPLLSMNDQGDSPQNGSLLVAEYGKGHYVYTGLSFFRELPAGVPGAFKLLANIVSYGAGQ
jgi:LmbE family N-acetylglucosaminyl deacetylase